MSRLSKIASEDYGGDQNTASTDASLLLFVQPIRKDRHRLARRIYELREQVQAAGGVTEKDIDGLISEYRQRKGAK